MDILNIRDGCAAVVVSRAELEEFGVTYDTLDCSSPETKMLASFALEKINENSNDGPSYSQGMTIEALPADDGGCILFFNFTRDDAKALRKNEREFYALESENLENICAFCSTAEKLKLCVTSSLYEKDGAYGLVFSSCALPRDRTERIITEYARVLPEREINYIYENWNVITRENASELLAKIAM